MSILQRTFNLEKQVNKRIQGFLLHKCTSENIEPTNAKLLFKAGDGKATAHLYETNRHVTQISLSSIVEFFGKDYTESTGEAMFDYLVKTSGEEQIELALLNVVICEVKGTMGAYLFEGPKYRKKISTVDLLTHFYLNK